MQLQTVSLKIRMDCEGCELKVKKGLSSLKGVKSVDVDLKQQKVTATGFVNAKKVLKAARSTGKKAKPWLCAKAPPAFVRATQDTSIATLREEHLTTMLSDENPNACSLM
ncbi:hypothetical protein NMG60_11031456 [Bertholletia excelsa]